MKRASMLLAVCVVLGGAVSCAAKPPASRALSPPPAPTTAVPAATPPASDDDDRPVPERVVAVHRKMLARSLKPGTAVQCIITVHDGQLSHDAFYAVALLAGGSLATWTESSSGPVDAFLAKLTPEEDERARVLLEELGRQRGAPRNRFSPSITVVGVSTRLGDRVETSYHPSDRTPKPLEELMQLVKRRLELTNAP